MHFYFVCHLFCQLISLFCFPELFVIHEIPFDDYWVLFPLHWSLARKSLHVPVSWFLLLPRALSWYQVLFWGPCFIWSSVSWWKIGSSFILLHVEIEASQHCLLKVLSFFRCIFFHLFRNQVTLAVWNLHPSNREPSVLPVPGSLCNYASSIGKSVMVIPPPVFFLFRSVWWFMGFGGSVKNLRLFPPTTTPLYP